MGSHRGESTGGTKIFPSGLHSDEPLDQDRKDHHARMIASIVIITFAVISFAMIVGQQMFSGPPTDSEEASVVETITETAEVEVTKTIKVPGPVVTREEPGPTVTQRITVYPAPAPTVTKTIKVPGPVVTKTVEVPGPTVTETVTKCPPMVSC